MVYRLEYFKIFSILNHMKTALAVFIMLALFTIPSNIGAEEIEDSIVIDILPDRLISNSDALLIVRYEDAPFAPEIEQVLTSDNSILMVDKNSIRVVGSNVMINLYTFNAGNATITVIPKVGKPISEDVKVYHSSDKPAKLLIKILPDKFSYIGPKNGYIIAQLVNSANIPIKAKDDYTIELTSSNPNVVAFDDHMTIKEGEYFAIKEFSVKGYGESIIKARYDDLIAEGNIISYKPSEYRLDLKIAPEIAPAVKGQKVYAFVQLQDVNGVPIYADKDIEVNIEASTDDILTTPAIIKAGNNIAIAELIINTDKTCKDVEIDLSNRQDFDPCIELYALADGLKSNTAFLELREGVKDEFIQLSNRIGDNKTRITPVIFPLDGLKIIADGREKVVGVIQLMTVESDEFDLASAKPVLPSHNYIIDSNSKDNLILKMGSITIEKPYANSLIKARTGYVASEAEVEFYSENIDSMDVKFRLYGHSNVKLYVEPMVDYIVKGMDFPYMVYFKDDQGFAAYAYSDMSMLVSMDKDIAYVESGYIKRGDASIVLDSYALEQGDANVRFDFISNKDSITLNEGLTILSNDKSSLRLDITDSIPINTKGIGSVMLVDNGDNPMLAKEDIDVYLYTSNDLIKVPRYVTIPSGKHYATFLIEAYNMTGTTDITAFADGFDPLNASIKIINDNLNLTLSKDKEPMLNERISITLNATYNGKPISNADVAWDSRDALPIEYDTVTDEQGVADAIYLITKEHSMITATLRYNGLERSASIVLYVNSTDTQEKIVKDEIDTIDIKPNSTGIESNIEEEDDNNIKLPFDIEYLLIIPAVAGVGLSIRKRLRRS